MVGDTVFTKCPGLIFVRPRFDVYRDISAAIHAMFKRYSDLVEGVALDEAYLDVTENKQNITYASTIASGGRLRHRKTHQNCNCPRNPTDGNRRCVN
ncbi:hypothetical protein [Nostoc sp. FACHB-888]|uniref:Y-family DNA polymerase n=1 Tax=Nostoc sp. FACHB-888 TaxID=2692842 RepID=UPI00322006C9